ncbi:MAG: hypothetical protein IJI63_00215 [Clostridiales bacterium]|nr:hypothetical protein [Clostridiales bacterium]
MKFIKAAAFLMSLSIVGMSLCACAGEPEPVSSDINVISTQAQNTGVYETTAAPYVFDYNNFIIGTVMDESKLPEPWDYDLSANCAYIGETPKYFTDSFEIYVLEDSKKIVSVELLNDTVSTPEGIHIGSTIDDVKLAYGDSPAMEGPNGIAYRIDSYLLQFEFNDAGKVTRLFYIEPQD